MKFVSGKISNYIGQIADKDQEKAIKRTDTYLVSVEKDLTNIWQILNSLMPNIGTATNTLTADAVLNFTYLPVVTAAPTGTPTVLAGHYASCYCAADNKIYVYIPTANWKKTSALT